jgi:hypothetical protein
MVMDSLVAFVAPRNGLTFLRNITARAGASRVSSQILRFDDIHEQAKVGHSYLGAFSSRKPAPTSLENASSPLAAVP